MQPVVQCIERTPSLQTKHAMPSFPGMRPIQHLSHPVVLCVQVLPNELWSELVSYAIFPLVLCFWQRTVTPGPPERILVMDPDMTEAQDRWQVTSSAKRHALRACACACACGCACVLFPEVFLPLLFQNQSHPPCCLMFLKDGVLFPRVRPSDCNFRRNRSHPLLEPLRKRTRSTCLCSHARIMMRRIRRLFQRPLMVFFDMHPSSTNPPAFLRRRGAVRLSVRAWWSPKTRVPEGQNPFMRTGSLIRGGFIKVHQNCQQIKTT